MPLAVLFVSFDSVTWLLEFLLDVPPTDPRAMPTLLAWIEEQVRAS